MAEVAEEGLRDRVAAERAAAADRLADSGAGSFNDVTAGGAKEGEVIQDGARVT